MMAAAMARKKGKQIFVLLKWKGGTRGKQPKRKHRERLSGEGGRPKKEEF